MYILHIYKNLSGVWIAAARVNDRGKQSNKLIGLYYFVFLRASCIVKEKSRNKNTNLRK